MRSVLAVCFACFLIVVTSEIGSLVNQREIEKGALFAELVQVAFLVIAFYLLRYWWKS